MVLNKANLLVIVLSMSLYMCNVKGKSVSGTVAINKQEIDSVMAIHGERIAILSCLRCQCFVEDFNKRFIKSGKRPDGFVLLTDTTCNKLLFATTYISSAGIDKISEDIYNLTLFKKSGSDIKVKIVAVENSNTADKVAQNFFKVN